MTALHNNLIIYTDVQLSKKKIEVIITNIEINA